MNFRCLAWGIILGLILSAAAHAQTFTPKYNSGINPNVTGYYEYLPAEYSLPQNANKKYPVLFYFHGAGELGNVSSNNLEKLKQSAIPRIITAGKFPNSFTVNGETFSYIVICPQFISSPINPSEVDAVINYVLSQQSVYRIDLVKEQNSRTEIYPNPTDQKIYLKLQNRYIGRINISVNDQYGRIVKRLQVNKQQEVFDYEANLSDLPTGIYFLQIRMGNTTENMRVVKL